MKVKKLVTFLQRPFRENLPFLLSLCILASGADLFFRIKYGGAIFGLYMALHGFIECYFIVLLTGFLSGISHKIVRGVLLFLGAVNLLMDTCVYTIIHIGFSFDTVCLILGTNPNEATEFLPMYLNGELIVFMLICIVLVVALLIFLPKVITKMPNYISILLMIILVGGIGYVSYRHSKNWETVFLGKIRLFLSYKSPEDLGQYRTSPKIIKYGEGAENIVLVIGESLAKSHCSVYGYEKQTQPHLEAMRDSSLIYVYSDVKSPWINTGPCMKAILSTWTLDKDEEIPWYRYTFFHDIFKAAGYESYWISNQASSGLFDNEIAKIAGLSDNVVWCGQQGIGSVGRSEKDEVLFNPIADLVCRERLFIGKKRVIIINLMGQHESFDKRFPPQYAHFSPSDYKDYPYNQRQTRADYDNSILYNDYVVWTILHLFDETESIVYYFPDHGLDVYASDPNYAGHARPLDALSFAEGTSIPFIVYETKIFKEKYPETDDLIQRSIDKPFCTENIFFTLMDIAKIKIDNVESIVQNE